MNKNTIYEYNRSAISHLTIDKAFQVKVLKYKHNWERKGANLDFLSGNTLGEQDVVFSVVDREMLFTDILKLDYNQYRTGLQKLDAVEVEHKNVSDARYNILIHLIIRTREMKVKEEDINTYIYNIYSIMFFMKMGSLLYGRYSEYRADANIAHATYESLSRDFIIKRFGSWYKVMGHVATDFYSRKYRTKYVNGTHYDRIVKPNDEDTLLIISGLNTKLGGYVGNYYNQVKIMQASGGKGSTTSMIVDFDESTTIREITNASKHVNYLKRIISLESDFIRPKLVEMVTELMNNNHSANDLTLTLRGLSTDYLDEPEVIQKLIDTAILYGINYLSTNHVSGNSITTEIENTLKLISGRWIAGKGQDAKVTEFKEVMMARSILATGKRSRPLTVTLSISTALYLFIRGVSGDKL